MMAYDLAVAFALGLAWSAISAPLIMIASRIFLRRRVAFPEAFWGVLLASLIPTFLAYVFLSFLVDSFGSAASLLTDVLIWCIIVVSAVIIPIAVIAVRVRDRSGVQIGWFGAIFIWFVQALACSAVLGGWQIMLR